MCTRSKQLTHGSLNTLDLLRNVNAGRSFGLQWLARDTKKCQSIRGDGLVYSEVRTNESYEIMVQIDDRRLAEDLNDQANCQAATTACDGIQL